MDNYLEARARSVIAVVLSQCTPDMSEQQVGQRLADAYPWGRRDGAEEWSVWRRIRREMEAQYWRSVRRAA